MSWDFIPDESNHKKTTYVDAGLAAEKQITEGRSKNLSSFPYM